MIKNSDMYNTRNQNENQNSGQKKGPGKKVRKLFRDIKKLKTYVRKLKVRVSNLQLDNDRLRRKVDMLTVQNNELLKNEPTSDNKQNQQKHPLSLNSPIFIPKNKNQTNNS